MKKIQSVKGMHDILPDTASKLRVLENLLINTSESFGYNEIRTPILENTDLFAKSIGDFFPSIDPNRSLFINLSYEKVISEANIINYDYIKDSFTLSFTKSLKLNN